MIDVTAETVVPFRELPKWTEKHFGKRKHPSTFHRWRLRGVRGVKLETILLGGIRFTSVEALNRFFAATTSAADGEACVVVPAKVDAAAVSKAEAFIKSRTRSS